MQREIDLMYDGDSSIIVNATEHTVHVSDDLLLKSGEYQLVQKEPGDSPTLHMIYTGEEGIAVKLLNWDSLILPEGEAKLHIVHLNPINPLVSVKAKYGDRLTRSLQYQETLDPILLFAPMDVPLVFTNTGEQDMNTVVHFVTKPNTHTLCVYTAYSYMPFCLIHIGVENMRKR